MNLLKLKVDTFRKIITNLKYLKKEDFHPKNVIKKVKENGWKKSVFWVSVVIIPGGEILLLWPLLKKSSKRKEPLAEETLQPEGEPKAA